MESSPSFLRTYGYVAGREAWLGWILLGIATVVVLVVGVLVLVAALRRRRPEPGRIEREEEGLRWIVIGGIVVPTVVLVFVLILTVTTQSAIATPAGADLTVRVTGRQWWWEVSYLNRSPSLIATTANEVHIPVGRPVRLEVVSGDVIHSFWIPELAGKTDLIPGQRERHVAPGRPGRASTTASARSTVVSSTRRWRWRWSPSRPPPSRRGWSASAPGGRRAGPTWPPGRRCSPPRLARCATPSAARERAAAWDRISPTWPAGGRSRPAPSPTRRGNLLGWIENPQAFKAGTLMPAVPLGAPSSTT